MSKNTIKSDKERLKGRYEWSEPTYFVKKNDDRYKSFKKTKKKTGVSPDEVWDLYGNICEFLIPRLIEFKKAVKRIQSYPGSYKSHKEWIKVLDLIIWTFKAISDQDDIFFDNEKQRERHYKKIDKGLQAFTDNFYNLWY